MFTGLVEEVGTVREVAQNGNARRIVVHSASLVKELRSGDSIAVNGVCLTAVNLTTDSFTADLAAETVARTSLSRLSGGTPVNLELPTKAGARLGGHVVQGHVDGVGRLVELERQTGGDDWRLTIEVPAELAKYIVFKGSIAIEGISLTVATVEGTRVSVAIIPHTYDSTNLKSLKPGDAVNIEVDVLAKYAEKMLQGEATSGITADRLMSEGF